MKQYTEVHGTQPERPQGVEVNGTTAFIRSNVRRETVSYPDISDREPTEEWVYDEVWMDVNEYDSFMALNLTIPEGMWCEGLLSLAREARYRRWDGPEQSTRRKIELGIDVEANKAKLAEILAYKQAVYETVNQPGYPDTEPVWPKEPEI